VNKNIKVRISFFSENIIDLNKNKEKTDFYLLFTLLSGSIYYSTFFFNVSPLILLLILYNKYNK